MEKHEAYNLSQVAKHDTKNDCWITINGRVLDVTKFLEEHPGGEEVVLEYAGKDATKAFEDIGHSKAAQDLLLKFHVGHLQGYDIKMVEDDDHLVSDDLEVARVKDMEAYVIKDDPENKKTGIVEFLVPLLVAGFYLGYRFMTGAVQF